MRQRTFQGVILHGLVLVALIAAAAHSVAAIDVLEVEEDIANLLPTVEGQDKSDTAETRRWALLPQAGYGPDTGPVAGVKYTHRDFLQTGATIDLGATYAVINQQTGLALSLSEPHLLDGRLLTDVRLRFDTNPQREFFGLGNNQQGPDPASTNSFQNLVGSFTVGWKLLDTVSLNLGVRLRKVNIGRGDERNHCDGQTPCPATRDEFPDLPGVAGGLANTLNVSLVWDDRDSIVRPTIGWRGILKVMHTNKSFFGDYEFTRYIADLSYLRAFFDDRCILGLRIGGEYVAGPNGQIPYWELAELGGEDTMRGFFPHRFVGQERVLLNAETRFLITEFDFYDLWHVKLDGVLFGDGGRVFLNSSEAKNEFKLNQQIFNRIIDNFQYSYGGGVRIALGHALVARIDAGFSEEETGLLYLSFGQTF